MNQLYDVIGISRQAFEGMVNRMNLSQRPILEIFNDELIQKPVNTI